MTKKSSEEISDILTPEAFKLLTVGQLLIFNQDGERKEYKITKLNRKSGKCWVIPVRTYSPSEVVITDVEASNV